jgi:hypothetical protein
MKALRITLQLIALFALVLGVTVVTLRIQNQNADGPSILFPGGRLVTGALHAGPDPDWSFTDELITVELQLDDPMSSRKTFIMEHAGKIYVPSGYMRSFLGRIWKEWAFQADEGDGLGMVRINDIRYERRLVRVKTGPALDGVAAKLAEKYAGGASAEAVAGIRQSVADGNTWIFELAPRES